MYQIKNRWIRRAAKYIAFLVMLGGSVGLIATSAAFLSHYMVGAKSFGLIIPNNLGIVMVNYLVAGMLIQLVMTNFQKWMNK